MAFEDFTTYTETDPQPALTVTSSRITATSATNSSNHHVTKDAGAGHFGDFTHLITFRLDSNTGITYFGIDVVANVSGNLEDINSNGVGLQLTYQSETGDTLYLVDVASTNEDFSVGVSDATTYYLTFSRSGTTGTCLIYSDSGRTTLLDTITVTCGSTTYRYLNASTGLGFGVDGVFSGYVENLDLQEAVASKQLATLGVG